MASVVTYHFATFLGAVHYFIFSKNLESDVTLIEGEKISVPAIRELPMTLECRVIYRQPQEMSLLPEDAQSRFYSPKYGLDKDEHITYIGEIVSSYIIL